MHHARAIVIAILLWIVAVPGWPQQTRAGVPLAIIVHPSRMVHLKPDDIVRIFLKKRRFWDDGEPIVVINQDVGTVAREIFSQRIFGSGSSRLGAYWNEQYFHGIFPPITLSSGAAVKRYVANDHNAIGYVELHQIDDSIRVALRLE